MKAYDYAKQQWVDGPEAVALRQRQLTEELTLLRGPIGPAYASFVGIESIPAAVASLEQQLKEVA